MIDRGSVRAWQQSGSSDAFARAKIHTREILNAYQAPALPIELVNEMRSMVERLAANAGLDKLPNIGMGDN